MTNVTRSAALKNQPLDNFINPFLEEEVPSEKMGGFNFDSSDMDYDPNSFKLYNSGKKIQAYPSHIAPIDPFFCLEEAQPSPRANNFALDYSNF